MTAQSIADGAMASVLCVLLRTPRKPLGVLHLDRTLWQKAFTKDDLHLADALAAHVSSGIEAAALLRKQRELFLNTITVLAQAVELKDEYTGGHTTRVTNFALMHALPRIAEASQDQGLFMEALIAAIAQGAPEAKERIAQFLTKQAGTRVKKPE